MVSDVSTAAIAIGSIPQAVHSGGLMPATAVAAIDTFRSAGGLWEKHRVEDVATPEGFARDPELVLRSHTVHVLAAGRIVESGAHIEKSLVFDHTRVGFTANARNLMLSGSYAVDSSGTVIDLVRSEMEWAVTDARQPRPELKFDHLLIQHEQLLREQHRSLFDILH